MKKYLPYIFGALLLTGMILLFMTGKSNKQKKLNERITLRRQDKIPYGNNVAYACLPYLFPKASILSSREEPGFWDSLSNYDAGQAYIVIADNFSADRDELRRMIKFASHGNDVFISARSVSDDVTEMLNCSVYDFSIPGFGEDEDGRLIAKDDSLKVRLRSPYFEYDSLFEYPGRKFSAGFSKVDNSIAQEIGEDDQHNTNFIRLKTGQGNFYLHLAPLSFSNYFLLYRNNIRYYQMLLSVIDGSATKVVWDEYYMNKGESSDNNRNSRNRNRGWLSVLFSYPALRAALLVALFTLIVYVLLEMRRKQRYVPVIAKPRNDSLEFVKTIGRLYHDKADHRNLARKMASYFLEHVRASYKIPTGKMDEEFIKAVQYKSGVPDFEIRGIVSFIKFLDETPAISEMQLTEFYKQLEIFYQKA